MNRELHRSERVRIADFESRTKQRQAIPSNTLIVYTGFIGEPSIVALVMDCVIIVVIIKWSVSWRQNGAVTQLNIEL